jgi:hypothetical protein
VVVVVVVVVVVAAAVVVVGAAAVVAQPEGTEHSGRPVRDLTVIATGAFRPTSVKSKHVFCKTCSVIHLDFKSAEERASELLALNLFSTQLMNTGDSRMHTNKLSF